MTLVLTSPAFADGAEIPEPHARDGGDASPPLRWTGAPPGTGAFALTVHDPDVPRRPWVHWVLYNLPHTLRALGPHVPKAASVPGGGKQGRNDYGELGWGGPQPPPGPAHRYVFRLFALRRPVALAPRATRTELMVALRESVLARAELTGIYRRL